MGGTLIMADEEQDPISKPAPENAIGSDMVPGIEQVPFIDIVKRRAGLPDDDAAKRFMTGHANRKKKENDAQGLPTTGGDIIDAIIEGMEQGRKKDEPPSFRVGIGRG